MWLIKLLSIWATNWVLNLVARLDRPCLSGGIMQRFAYSITYAVPITDLWRIVTAFKWGFANLFCNATSNSSITSTVPVILRNFHYFPLTWALPTKSLVLLVFRRCFAKLHQCHVRIFVGPTETYPGNAFSFELSNRPANEIDDNHQVLNKLWYDTRQWIGCLHKPRKLARFPSSIVRIVPCWRSSEADFVRIRNPPVEDFARLPTRTAPEDVDDREPVWLFCPPGRLAMETRECSPIHVQSRTIDAPHSNWWLTGPGEDRWSGWSRLENFSFQWISSYSPLSTSLAQEDLEVCKRDL